MGKGLPIGNLTSQFFANIYLDRLDHLIKDEMGVRCYLRYMDDFLIFGWSVQQLNIRFERIKRFLADKLKLKVNDQAFKIGSVTSGIHYLGAHIFKGTIRINGAAKRRSLKRIKKKSRQWRNNKMGDQQFTDSLTSIAAHLNGFSKIRCGVKGLP